MSTLEQGAGKVKSRKDPRKWIDDYNPVLFTVDRLVFVRVMVRARLWFCVEGYRQQSPLCVLCLPVSLIYRYTSVNCLHNGNTTKIAVVRLFQVVVRINVSHNNYGFTSRHTKNMVTVILILPEMWFQLKT